MQRTPVKFRPLLWPTLLTLLALPVLIGLGLWQLDRREWKLDLIAKLEERQKEPPILLPNEAAWGSLPLEELYYRHVRIKGEFLHDKEIHWFAQDASGQVGYQIITPVALEFGGYVLVDRGFVPASLKTRETRPETVFDAEADLVGSIVPSAVADSLDLDPDLQTNIWYVRDVQAMAAWREVTPAAPFLVIAEEPSPQAPFTPIPVVANLRNEHLNYALTWFGLAGALIAVYLAYHLARGRFRAPADDEA